MPAGSFGVLAPPLAQLRPLFSVRHPPLGAALSMGLPLPIPGSMPGLITLPVPQWTVTSCAAELTVCYHGKMRRPCTAMQQPHLNQQKAWQRLALVQDGTHTFSSPRNTDSA